MALKAKQYNDVSDNPNNIARDNVCASHTNDTIIVHNLVINVKTTLK